MYIFIPVTRKVKWYTRFVGKYVTGRRKESRFTASISPFPLVALPE